MKWLTERAVVNGKPGYYACTPECDYRVVPVFRGYRLHWKPRNESTWKCSESVQTTVRYAKALADDYQTMIAGDATLSAKVWGLGGIAWRVTA